MGKKMIVLVLTLACLLSLLTVPATSTKASTEQLSLQVAAKQGIKWTSSTWWIVYSTSLYSHGGRVYEDWRGYYYCDTCGVCGSTQSSETLARLDYYWHALTCH